MTLNELGTIFMIWWITMGVVKGLWDLINDDESTQEFYKNSEARLYISYRGFQKVIMAIELVIWPIVLVADFIRIMRSLVHKIKER